MSFVQYANDGVTIVGLFANAQAFATIELADTDPAVVAFRTPSQVPQSVALWQAKAALQNAGLLDAVNAAITATNNPAIIAFWANAQIITRTSSTLALIAAQLNLTSAQIDALFVAAAAITL